MEYVFRNEGLDTFTDHPLDRGGKTKWGVTEAALRYHQKHYTALRGLEVRDLTKTHALQLYSDEFWRFEDIEDSRLATKLLDIYVNLSPKGAITVMQRAVNRAGQRVVVDGKYGMQTMTALNACYPPYLLDQRHDDGRADALAPGVLCSELALYYARIVQARPSQAEFIVGWLSRAYRVPLA